METHIFKLTSYGVEDLIRADNPSPALMRIRASYKAYGADYDFLRFFGDEKDSILICVQDGLAIVHVDDVASRADPAAFLAATVGTVLSCQPLSLEKHGFTKEEGWIYSIDNPPAIEMQGVVSGIQEGYDLLEQVFPKSINSETYSKWYTDLSHRARHGVSQIYTLQGICSCTAYANENDTLLITHLGTKEGFRLQGYATRMLWHIAYSQAAKKMLLLSQNPESDIFYERVGFEKTGKWFIYDRIEPEQKQKQKQENENKNGNDHKQLIH